MANLDAMSRAPRLPNASKKANQHKTATSSERNKSSPTPQGALRKVAEEYKKRRGSDFYKDAWLAYNQASVAAVGEWVTSTFRKAASEALKGQPISTWEPLPQWARNWLQTLLCAQQKAKDLGAEPLLRLPMAVIFDGTPLASEHWGRQLVLDSPLPLFRSLFELQSELNRPDSIHRQPMADMLLNCRALAGWTRFPQDAFLATMHGLSVPAEKLLDDSWNLVSESNTWRKTESERKRKLVARAFLRPLVVSGRPVGEQTGVAPASSHKVPTAMDMRDLSRMFGFDEIGSNETRHRWQTRMKGQRWPEKVRSPNWCEPASDLGQ